MTFGQGICDGLGLTRDCTATLLRIRSEVAMVFHDPFNALNPHMTVGETLAEVLRSQGETPEADSAARIDALVDRVGPPISPHANG